MPNKCIICGTVTLRLHVFPKDEELCRKWLRSLGFGQLVGLVSSTDLKRQGILVCGQHFRDDSYYCPLRRNIDSSLLPSAVPTEHVQIEQYVLEVTHYVNSQQSDLGVAEQSTEGDNDSVREPVERLKRKFDEDVSSLTRENQVLKRTVKVLKSKIWRRNRSLKALKEKQSRSQQRVVPTPAPAAPFRMDSLPGFQQHVLHDINAASAPTNTIKSKGKRWTDAELEFALAIRSVSAAAYRALRSRFPMPSLSTLRRRTRKLFMKTGICEEVCHLLRARVKSMEEQDRNVTLSLDGMTVKPSLQYEASEDHIIGFESYAGEECSPYVANQTVLFAIRGLRKNWKQEIGIYHVAHHLKSSRLKFCISGALAKMSELGLRVRALVLDRESTQTKVLIGDLKVSPAEPWLHFDLPDEKSSRVFAIWDPPHLLKSIRNFLMRYDLKTELGTAKWAHLVQLFNEDNRAGVVGVSVCSKLTRAHFFLGLASKMRVKLAAQVLSRSVAAGLRYYVELRKLPQDASQTAVVVERINDMFDLMNSSRVDLTGPKRPIQRTHLQQQMKNLQEAAEFVRSWSMVSTGDPGKRINVTPLIRDIQITLNAIQLLATELIEVDGFDFVCSRRMNQDHVENCFSKIRAYNGLNTTPTVSQFQVACRSVSFRHIFNDKNAGHGNDQPRNTNCEDDECESFEEPTVVVPASSTSRAHHAVPMEPSCPLPQISIRPSRAAKQDALSSLFDVPNNLSPAEHGIVEYIGGWLARQVEGTTDCNACSRVLRSEVGQWKLIEMKRFHFVGEDALTAPSSQLHAAVFHWEIFFRRKINLWAHHSCLLQKLLRYISHICPKTIVCDFGHDLTADLLRRFLKLRIYRYCRMRNRQLVDSKLLTANKLRRLNVV